MTSFNLEVIYVSKYTENGNNENLMISRYQIQELQFNFLWNLGKYVSCVSKCVYTRLADGIGDT